MPNSWFQFKQFNINHDLCAHKVGTDGVLLGAWAKHPAPAKILDIGSGSGLVSLMMAQRFPNSSVSAIEIHEPSFKQGSENFAASPFAERLQAYKGDFLTFPFQEKFDLIVSNPPFFKGVFSSGRSERDQARHERALSHSLLMKNAEDLLNPKGIIAIVISTEEAPEIISVARELGLSLTERVKVFGNPGAPGKRRLLSFSVTAKPPREKILVLRDEQNQWSEDYKALTKDFYLKF